MPTPFAAVDDLVSAAIDGEFGEQFTLTAFKDASSADVNLPVVADGAKAAQTVTGVWEGIADAKFPRARGDAADDDAIRRGSAYPSVSVRDDSLAWRPFRGCRCKRLHDNKTYEVEQVLSDGMGRTLITLGSVVQ